jgi:hypothetical protein
MRMVGALVVIVCAACGKSGGGDKPSSGTAAVAVAKPTEPAKPPAPPPNQVADQPAPIERTDLGALGKKGETATWNEIAFDAAGVPLIGINSARKVEQWKDAKWTPAAEGAPCDGNIYIGALAAGKDTVYAGGIALGESGAGASGLVCIAQIASGMWTPLGSPVGDPATLASDVVIVPTADGPVIARATNKDLAFWRWDGTAWQSIAPPPRAPDSYVGHLVAAPTSDGAVFAWYETVHMPDLKVVHLVSKTGAWEPAPALTGDVLSQRCLPAARGRARRHDRDRAQPHHVPAGADARARGEGVDLDRAAR